MKVKVPDIGDFDQVPVLQSSSALVTSSRKKTRWLNWKATRPRWKCHHRLPVW